jgi:hypothetical protein
VSTSKAPDLTLEAVEEAIGPLDALAQQCHGASLALVRSGLLPKGSRVARGSARGVGAQHSWVLVDPQNGVYDQANWVIDITLWSYIPDVPRLYVAKARRWPHVPHGSGSIWRGAYRPPDPVEDVIYLDVPPSARKFLEVACPDGLDRRGWQSLFNSPMQGWPSAEVIEAARQHPELRNLVPIDIAGMLTDENPGGLYF